RSEQVLGHVQGRRGTGARPHEQRQQLAVGEGGRAVPGQALARPFLGRQVADAPGGERNTAGRRALGGCFAHVAKEPMLPCGPRGANPARLTERRPGPNNARAMDKGGSVPGRTRLPALLAPVVVLAGMATMLVAGRPAFVLGLRPALLISELALTLPGLLALPAFPVPLAVGLGLNPPPPRTPFFLAG